MASMGSWLLEKLLGEVDGMDEREEEVRGEEG